MGKSSYVINVVNKNEILNTAFGGKTVDKSDTTENEKYSLEEALTLTEYGKFHILLVILTGIALVGSTVENISISFILPYAKCDLHFSTIQQSLANTISFLGFVVSSHFWGFMADTWGRRKVMRLAAICGFISSFISAFVTSVNVLIFFRFIVGLFVSGLQASAFSYISEFHTKETCARAASFAVMFLPVIFLLMPSVAFIIIPMDWSFYILSLKFSPWRLFLIIMSLVNLFNFIVFSLLPETPKFLLSMNEKEETLRVLRKMYASNTGNPKELYPVKDVEQESSGNSLTNTKGFTNILKLVWIQTKPIFVPPYLDSTVKLSYMIFVLYSVGHGAFMWFPDFLVQLQSNSGLGKTLCEIVGHGATVENLSDECSVDNKNTTNFQIIFLVGIIFVSISAVISFYLDKIGAKTLVTVWLVFSSISCIALNYLVEFYSIVASFITFLSCSMCASIISAISVNLFPTNIRAMATSFIFMFGRVGGLVGGNFIGLLLENSCSLIFYIFGALCLSCVLVFLMIKKKTKEESG